MANDQNDWDVANAMKPFLLTFLFLFISLLFLSFPGRFNRFITFSCVVTLAGAAFSNSDQLFPDSYAEEIYLRFVIIYLAHFSFLCLMYDRRNEGKLGVHKALRTLPQSSWLCGYKLLFNCRGIGAEWELPYLWNDLRGSKPLGKLTTANPKEASQIKSTSRGKWSGVARRCGYLVLNYLVICVYYEYLDLAIHVRLQPSDSTQEKESIVRRALGQYISNAQGAPITHRELVVRVWAIVDIIVPDYLILSAYHDFFAIIFIATGLDESWEWPPLFGPISEAYNVRRYWSIFWHRLIYRSFNAHAAETLSVLGQKQRTLGSRLLQNFLVFAFSAAMHGLVSWKMGNQCAFDRNLFFWLLQPVAFVLEGLVTSYWRRWRVSLLLNIHSSTVAAFERLVGYIWVFAWLFWCAPKGRLPMVFCGQK